MTRRRIRTGKGSSGTIYYNLIPSNCYYFNWTIYYPNKSNRYLILFLVAIEQQSVSVSSMEVNIPVAIRSGGSVWGMEGLGRAQPVAETAAVQVQVIGAVNP